MKAERINSPILVTGATGFIGRRLVDRLVGDGYRPRALVLPGNPIPMGWQARVDVVRGDVTQRSEVAEAVRDTETVFHLAAFVSDWGGVEQHERITVLGTEHLLAEAARAGARILLASSLAVYGDALGRCRCSEDQPFGKTFGPYGRSKQAQETIARRLERDAGLKVTIIRPANVFGPASELYVDQAVKQLRRGRPTLIDGGRNSANLTYIDNVVDVFVRAAERPDAVGRVYNANDENDTTWLRYFTDLAKLADLNPPWSIPLALAGMFATGLEVGGRIVGRRKRPAITHEALNLLTSREPLPIDRARTELGYEPIVSYAEAMEAVARYLAEKPL